MGGLVIEITTQSIVPGGAPMVQTLIVAESDPAKALMIVQTGLGTTPDEKVEVVRKVSAQVIEALKLPPGKAGVWSIK